MVRPIRLRTSLDSLESQVMDIDRPINESFVIGSQNFITIEYYKQFY